MEAISCKYALLILLIIWELVWKAVAMWRAARKGQKAWYVCIVVFNTVGILSIVYLLLNRGKVSNSGV